MTQVDDIIVSLDTCRRAATAANTGITDAVATLRTLKATVTTGMSQPDVDALGVAVEAQCTALTAIIAIILTPATELRVSRGAVRAVI